MKEPLSTQDRHEHIQREVIDLSFSERLVEQQVFVYLSDATTYIQYNIPDIIKRQTPIEFPYGILPFHVWRGQERIPPIPLELLVCDHVVGVHPASARSNLKKGVNTYIWMKLNTIDGNKIKLWILFTYFKLFVRQEAPLSGQAVNELANVVST